MVSLQRVRTVVTGVAGTPAYSNLYFTLADGNAQACVDAVAALWAVLREDMVFAATWTVQGEVALVDSVSGDVTQTTTVTSRAGIGNGSSTMLPPANQVLVRLGTSTFNGGRRVQGRFNLGYLWTAAQTGTGTVAANTSARVANGFNALRNDPATELVVWSRKNGTAAPVTAVSVSPNFAVLTSRRD